MVCTARIQKSSFAVGEMSTGLTNQLGFEIPSWVQIPSGAGIFPSSPVGSINNSSHIYIILTFAHLGGWLAASLVCLKVTA